MNTEPALWTGIVQAALVLAVAFGAPLTTDQRDAILGVTAAALALVGAVVVRAHVTPSGTPRTTTDQP